MADAPAPIDVIGRELPYSQDAELAVIGSALTNPHSVAESAEIVKPSDFYFPQNREIYSAILELFNENLAIDFITVSNRLSQNDKLEAVGGITYLRNAATNVPTTRHVTYYSSIIKDKATLRALIQRANAISDMAYSESDKVERVVDQAEQLIFDVSASRERGDILPVSEIFLGSYQEIVESATSQGGITGLSTGFDELNRRTGGFHGGELILVAGRPGMGKSSFAVNIAEYVSIAEKKTVAIFNLEMPKEQIVNRIICSQALVDSNKIRTGDITGEDWEKIGSIVDKVSSAPLYIDDTASITVSEIRAKCRRLKQTKNLSMVVIDYLQLMQSSGRAENRQQEISEISRSLKILAKELAIPVVALSQLSRASESRSDKRPVLSDLRESGAIEQDADIVMFLYRDDYYKEDTNEKNIAECRIAKNRSGETGTFKLGWNGKYTKFSNLEFAVKEE
ncbi:MAG: replicative DNA helicase [Firmicutes bacterium]|nr:replicative DNA helicase [Bacillota bacterium]